MAKIKENPEVEKMRHSCSHVMAQAVLQMFPEAKLAIGPSIADGFYYDFDLPRTLIPEDLEIIEEKMKKIVKEKQKFEYSEKPIDDALDFYKKVEQNYKFELIRDLKDKGENKVSFYENIGKDGEVKFADLCKGPHVEDTSKIGAFKLVKIAGAYWRGDEKNKMLQRIYGYCFEDKDKLYQYIKMMEEAKKRDHREIGKKMDLFSFQEEGPGFPFWHPKGMILQNELLKYWREIHEENGYQEIKTPIILNVDLWHQSGHYDNYKENMYFTEIDETGYAVKPMNCPGGCLVYKNSMHSYRELPIRNAELGLVHRHEKSGVLHGLFRVRNFTQDDAHIFCTTDQMKDEIKNVIKLCDQVYKKFGYEYHIELSTRPEKSIGSDEIWEKAESTMKEIMEELGRECIINEGDGAFYGPKFDFHLKDCIGRTWQCGTVQLDFSMPERFGLEYTGEDGKPHRPVMIHRVIFGSLERFIGILIEHFAGDFPLWLAPTQVSIIPVSDKFVDFARDLKDNLKKFNLRIEIDESQESVGKKIRNAEIMKVPYMLVVGEKEIESGKLVVRKYSEKEQKEMRSSGKW